MKMMSSKKKKLFVKIKDDLAKKNLDMIMNMKLKLKKIMKKLSKI